MNHFFSISILCVFILGSIFSTSSLSEESKNPDDAAKAKSSKKTRHPKITISKDITYVEGPLRADGYVDYLAALNKYCSQGITPENNAAISFIKAIGPKELEKETRNKYFKMLGIAELSEEGPYLVTISDFILS